MSVETHQFASQVFRSAIQVLEANGWWVSVRNKLSAASLETLRTLPLNGFHDAKIMQEMNDALMDLYGEPAVAKFSHQCTRVSIENMKMHSILEGLLRLWGPSPELLLSRMNTTNTKGVRGQFTRWTSTGPKSGILDYTFTGRRELSTPALLGVYYSLLATLEFLGRPDAKVTRLTLLNTTPNDVTYRTVVSWP